MNDPKKPVEDEEFWRMRLVQAHVTGRGLHSAVYDTDPETWNTIQNETAGLLQRILVPRMKVLDAGCAYGPIYSLVPSQIEYVGIDISPHFIEIAKLRHPEADFRVGNLADLSEFNSDEFEIVICRSVEEMIRDNIGDSTWSHIFNELRRVGKKLLLIGYNTDPLDWSLS